MPFERPWFAALLAALPFLAAFYYWAARRRRRDMARLARLPIQPYLIWGGPRPILRAALTLTALAWLALAAAGLGRRGSLDNPRVERDILLILDASKSMAAEDVDGSRLALAKAFARSLVSRLQGERVGIALYAGKAAAQCPFTRDYEAAGGFLENVSPGILPYPGTALQEAFQLAADAFEREPKRARLAVLLTDGEDHGRDPTPLAEQLKQARVELTAVCIGTVQGALIPLYSDDGTLQDYKNDRTGNPVVTRANPSFVSALAKKAGGESIHLDGSGSFAGALDRLTRSKPADRQNRFWNASTLLLMLTLAFLLAESAADRLPFKTPPR